MPEPTQHSGVWNVLTALVLLACIAAAWSVVGRMVLWQPPVSGYSEER